MPALAHDLKYNLFFQELCSGDVWKRCMALGDDYEIQERYNHVLYILNILSDTVWERLCK